MLLLQITLRFNKMINIKPHTTGKTGNFVRYFLFLAVLALLVISCEKLDTESNDIRDNLVGTWSCSESYNSQPQNYQVIISKSTTDTTKIIISNFNLLGNDIDVFAKVNGLNLNIPNQTVDGYQISGSGSMASNHEKINLTYSVNTGSEIEHWTAVYSK